MDPALFTIGKRVSASTVIVDAERKPWRCRCLMHPLFAMYTDLGGVHMKFSGKLGYQLNYVFNLKESGVLAHCPSCHSWRFLRINPETDKVIDEEWTGDIPDIECADRRCKKKVS